MPPSAEISDDQNNPDIIQRNDSKPAANPNKPKPQKTSPENPPQPIKIVEPASNNDVAKPESVTQEDFCPLVPTSPADIDMTDLYDADSFADPVIDDPWKQGFPIGLFKTMK